MPMRNTEMWVASLFLIFAVLPVHPAFADDIDRQGTGQWCYEAIHPASTAEKEAFIENVSSFAITAERKWGVPAPVLAGMAIVESGYGLTRLAIKSNDILAFKWPGRALAQGHNPFTLTCQPPPETPPYDVGNVYISFARQADAMDFIAGRLKLSKYYAAATQTYQNELQAGVSRQAAAERWLSAIAPSYNYDPAAYLNHVEQAINAPMAPGGTPLWSLQP